MQRSDNENTALTPQESWQTINESMDRARSSMYVAGTTTILLLWGVIASLGLISQYALESFAPQFTSHNPWISAPLWGVLVTVGMVSSAIIGHRAGSRDAAGGAHSQRRHQGVFSSGSR